MVIMRLRNGNRNDNQKLNKNNEVNGVVFDFTRARTQLLLLSIVCFSCFQATAGIMSDDRKLYQNLFDLKPKASDQLQRDTVVKLIQRLLPLHHQLIEIVVDRSFITQNHLDRFKIENDQNKKIKITGSTGVAVSNGLHYYLKYVANCSVSWSGDQLKLPINRLPMPEKTIDMVIREKFRYYMNVCTVSYSSVWWNWDRWQREIDWMVLHGINLPLAFNGQEQVYRNTFLRFNLTKDEIDDYFTGPAFLAWNRMGNIQSWGGPLTENWHQHQFKLQKQILEQMRSFGMFPVVPGFAGHVPRKLESKLPKAKISKLTDWNYFGKNFSYTHFLEPESPLFVEIGKTFIEEYIKLYGTDHFYNIDLFNEEAPPFHTVDYLNKIGSKVYESIRQADPNGTWVMQAWFFYHDSEFWGPKQVEALVTSVPIGRMLILDLFSEIHPVYSKFNGYYKQPFVWCMLHNFGGTTGMYGAFNRINEKVYEARKNYSNMLGIGLTPEGIEQNEIVYDYMTEVVWYDQAPDMPKWVIQYAARRYGFHDPLVEKAWNLLLNSVYTDPIGISNHGKYNIIQVPQTNLRSILWYKPRLVGEALSLLAKYAKSNSLIESSSKTALESETFVYDLVDVARQTLQLLFDDHYKKLMEAYKQNNSTLLEEPIKKIREIFDLLEDILEASDHCLLYSWITKARSLGADQKEQDFNEWQARNQITIWGPKAQIRDYASKQWSGMFKYYYKPRWELFFTTLQEDIKHSKKFDYFAFTAKLFAQVEKPFTYALNQDLVKKGNVTNLLHTVDRVLHEIQSSPSFNTHHQNQLRSHQTGINEGDQEQEVEFFYQEPGKWWMD